jgi:outer membrane murein-binding lipoprotein Lpp
VTIAVVVTAVVVGGGVWYFLNQQVTTDKNDLNSQISSLQTQLSSLKNTSTTTATTDTANATADWKTYTSSSYNYSVKYPADATYSEISSTGTTGPDKGYIVDFANVSNMTIRVQATKNTSTATDLKGLIATNLSLNISDRNAYTQITVGGQPAYKYINYLDATNSQKIGASVLVLKGGYYYQISTGSQFSPTFTSALESAFDQFVSTFQFTK